MPQSTSRLGDTTDAAVGRTFWTLLTPYVGLGADAIYARERSDAVELRSETLLVPHATGGMELRVWRLALGAEGRLSAVNNFQLQLAVVF